MALPDEIQSLVTEVNNAAHRYTPTNAGKTHQSTDTPRHRLLNAAKNLVTALEDPEEEAWRFVLQPTAHVCLITAHQCGILTPWPKKSMSSTELASMSKADQVLIVRIMRALVIYGIFIETEEEIYEHSALSMRLATPPILQSALPMATRVRGMSHLPEYLADISYRNPGANPADKTLFQWSNNTEQEFFQWMQNEPKQLAAFNTSMAKSVATERNLTDKGFADVYPFESEMGISSPDEIVVVDIGGGYGQALQDLREHLPGLKGKMVLEDLPETVKAAPTIENVEAIPYNFFKQEQPVKGARTYLLRHILHDWSDHSSREILKNTIPALVEGKSKILLVEVVLPPMNAPVFGALMDINMMKYAGSGRKEKQWRELLDSVGLEIIKIWPPVKNDSVMEAVPKSWSRK